MTGFHETAPLYRAQARGLSGWVDGGLFIRRQAAESDAQRMAALYGTEVRVVSESWCSVCGAEGSRLTNGKCDGCLFAGSGGLS